MNDIPHVPTHPGSSNREGYARINGEQIPSVATPEAFRKRIEELEAEKDALRAEIYALKQQGISLTLENKKLEKEAFHDPMTGLLNRRGLAHTADKIYDEARENNETPKFCVAIFDLRGLGAINNSQGHEAGDEYLQSFVKHITASLRPEDSLARWGGDEFAVVLPNSSEEDAQKIMDNINNTLPEDIRFRAGFAASEDLARLYRRVPTFREIVDIADLAQNDAKAAEKNPQMGVTSNTLSLGDILRT